MPSSLQSFGFFIIVCVIMVCIAGCITPLASTQPATPTGTSSGTPPLATVRVTVTKLQQQHGPRLPRHCHPPPPAPVLQQDRRSSRELSPEQNTSQSITRMTTMQSSHCGNRQYPRNRGKKSIVTTYGQMTSIRSQLFPQAAIRSGINWVNAGTRQQRSSLSIKVPGDLRKCWTMTIIPPATLQRSMGWLEGMPPRRGSRQTRCKFFMTGCFSYNLLN